MMNRMNTSGRETAGIVSGKETDVMGKMRQYSMDGAMIIGVDHGYGNIKTAHFTFPTCVLESEKPPVLSKDYLEYDGKYHIIGEGHKDFVADKVEDNDYYILTLAAVAKEMKERGVHKGKVILAAGLPLKWVAEQQKTFREYLMRKKHVEFRYREEHYEIEFVNCLVMPQCYSAVAEHLGEFQGLNLLVDIGNGTMNLMYLNNGKAMEKKAWTEKFGVYQCFIRIRNEVMDATGVKLDDMIIENFLRNGETDVAEPFAGLIRKAAENYVREIFAKLKDYEFNEKLMKLHFMGGGAKLVKTVGEYEKDRTFFDCDIRSTAKGYEYYAYMVLRSRKHQ